MHDLGYFRANFDTIAARLATRSNPPSLDTFRDLDARRRAAIHESEELKARRNSESAEIAALRKQGADTTEKQSAVRAIGERSSRSVTSSVSVARSSGHSIAVPETSPSPCAPCPSPAMSHAPSTGIGR